MIKYTCQFSCWRLGPVVFFVIASEVVSKTVVRLLVTRDGKESCVVHEGNVPEEYLRFPVKYVGLPAMVRVRVREKLATAVAAEIGGEAMPAFNANWSPVQ